MYTETVKGGMLRREWPTWGAFLDHCLSATDMPDARRFSMTRRDSWNGDIDLDGAVKLGREGWADGLAKVRALADPLVSVVAAQIERHEPEYVLEGTGALDIGRYLDGEPECWIRFAPVMVDSPGTKHLTLVFNATVNGMTSPETIISRGAVAAALVDLLEMTGHRVKVLVGYANQSGRYQTEMIVPVKAFDQPLDADRLVFALAHPSSLRKLALSAWEHMPEVWRARLNVGFGYGQARNISDESDITIETETRRDWTDPQAARTWIMNALRAQGVTLRESPEGSAAS